MIKNIRSYNGILLDSAGILCLFGTFALLSVRYFYELGIHFDPTADSTMLLGLICWLTGSFQTLNNYKRHASGNKGVNRKTEDGLYWVHFLGKIFEFLPCSLKLKL